MSDQKNQKEQEEQEEQEEQKERKDYTKIDLRFEVNKKINSLDITRNNRINMATRYTNYSEKWKFIFLCLNIEAIFFIVLSLTNNNGIFEKNQFIIYSSSFSIYVILLQSYINEFNYSGRALKADYHQLELEDQILKLKNIMINLNNANQEPDLSLLHEQYNFIMNNYQITLKNNENHSSIDRKRNEFLSIKKDKKIKWLQRQFLRIYYNFDFSIHNFTIYINYFVILLVLIILIGGVL